MSDCETFYVFFSIGNIGCTTVSGSKPNASCIFPFKFNGITFDECTTEGTDEGDITPWCSTLVDDSGVHVGDAGNWGNCGPDCNLKIGKKDFI